MPEEVGIVLKSFFPYKCKISVLSRNSGKVNLFVRSLKLSPGTFISFYLKKVEVLHVPLSPLDMHLTWIHHMLEICYYFVPINSACTDVFRLLQYSLKLGVQSSSFEPYFYIVKRICLIRLLVLLGFYPKGDLVPFISLFDDLVGVSLDSLDGQKVRLLEAVTVATVKKIDKWILSCLQEHSHFKQFNTVPFFYNSLEANYEKIR